MVSAVRVGVMFRCSNPPESLPGFARQAESLGYQELWLVEDCFYAAAIGTATAALCATGGLPVGIGVLPAVLRNPALAAMELSGLARMFPGRLMAGFGHGVADWMRQVGAFPDSQLAALGETLTAVRSLLAGERVDVSGRHAHLDGVRLEHPPAVVPPVYTGVRGARSLRLSGERADGTILAELSSPGYIRWARERIDEGRLAAGRSDHHRVTVYALLESGDEHRTQTRRWAARELRASGPAAGVGEELAAEVTRLAGEIADDDALAAALPDGYLDPLCLSGGPEEIAAGIEALGRAGTDAVVLCPSPDPRTADGQLRQVAVEVLPLLSRSRC